MCKLKLKRIRRNVVSEVKYTKQLYLAKSVSCCSIKSADSIKLYLAKFNGSVRVKKLVNSFWNKIYI